MKSTRIGRSDGFTLVEVLTVVAIIGALTSVSAPNYLRYRSDAASAACEATRRNIEMAEISHYATYSKPSMSISNEHACPTDGTYVWMVSDPDDPAYPKVVCSTHSHDAVSVPPTGTDSSAGGSAPGEEGTPGSSTPSEGGSESQPDPGVSTDTTPKDFVVPTGESISANDGFESIGKTPRPKRWTYINSSEVDGWSANGSSMEVWSDGMLGVNAPEGDYFIELDSRRRLQDSIYQEIETESGRIYEIQFQAQARRDRTSDFEVSWGGETVGQITPERRKWNSYAIEVVGTGAPITVALSEIAGQDDGLGPLLDAIKVVPTDRVR